MLALMDKDEIIRRLFNGELIDLSQVPYFADSICTGANPKDDPHGGLNIDIVRVESWSHFLDLAQKFDVHPGVLHGFRGHSDATYNLSPSLLRHFKKRNVSEANALHIEDRMIREFKGQAHHFMPTSEFINVKNGKFGWLTVMQHHGALRCLGFSGQSNSLFCKEEEGRSNGPTVEGKGAQVASNVLGGIQARSRADAPGWAFSTFCG
jgi:hypothetical protein